MAGWAVSVYFGMKTPIHGFGGQLNFLCTSAPFSIIVFTVSVAHHPRWPMGGINQRQVVWTGGRVINPDRRASGALGHSQRVSLLI